MPRLRLRLRALFRGELIHDVFTDPPAPSSPIELTILSPPPQSPSPQNSSPSPSPRSRSPSPHPNSYLYLPPYRKPVAIYPTYDPNFLHETSPPLLHIPIPQETPSAPPHKTHPRTTGLITPHAVFKQLLYSQQPITEGEWIAMGKARERERQRQRHSRSQSASSIRNTSFLERCRERHRRRKQGRTSSSSSSSACTTVSQERGAPSENHKAYCCTKSSMHDILASFDINTDTSDSTNSSTAGVVGPDKDEDDEWSTELPNEEWVLAFCGEPLDRYVTSRSSSYERTGESPLVRCYKEGEAGEVWRASSSAGREEEDADGKEDCGEGKGEDMGAVGDGLGAEAKAFRDGINFDVDAEMEAEKEMKTRVKG